MGFRASGSLKKNGKKVTLPYLFVGNQAVYSRNFFEKF